jgi:steroid 5-alpha reductase family enzyme
MTNDLSAMQLFGTEVENSIFLTFLIIFGIQLVFYIISAILQTEKYYDLSGAMTYQAAILTAIINKPSVAPRQIILATLGLIWCTRLGTFLFLRVLKHEDKRFAELKTDPIKFMIPWFFQICWIFFTAFPIYVVVGNASATQQPIMWSDIIGILIWIFGFGFEAIADQQKSNFKKDHPRDFITTGLWKYSRYANYFGEVTLWYGIFILACAGVAQPWQWVMVFSPIFVTMLLVFGTGVALSEKGAEERYGSRQGISL